jgi:hypothetical protein
LQNFKKRRRAEPCADWRVELKLPVVGRPRRVRIPADRTDYLVRRITLFKGHTPLQTFSNSAGTEKRPIRHSLAFRAALLPGGRPEALVPGGEGGYRPTPEGTQAENAGS